MKKIFTLLLTLTLFCPLVCRKKFAPQESQPIETTSVDETKSTPMSLLSPSTLFSQKVPYILVIILAFFYGILISFTPCVYPLIPITAAVLSSQASTSPLRNFMLSLSYVLGNALVYAILGYIVATTTIIFGQWLANPFVILFTLLFLLYLALSLFGFYELYIPRFLRNTAIVEPKGSLIYSFFAGALAGTIASPCLSPALFTVLIYAAEVGNPLIAFLTLFSFALGIGMLLLLIGFSTTSLAFLPKSGPWLSVIKKILGLILLGYGVYLIKTLTRF